MATREIVEIVITGEGMKVIPASRAADLGINAKVGGDVWDEELVEIVIAAEKLGLALTIRRDANSIKERL